MDWDKNGSVSFVEFKSYLAKLKKGEDFDHGEALAAFQSIDEDGSRQLTWEEFFVRCTLFENHSKCRLWIFEFWHIQPIFVLSKLICLVTLFDRKLQVFKNLPKLTIFWHF